MGWLARLKRKAVAPTGKRAAAAESPPPSDAADWKAAIEASFELTQVLGRGGYSTVFEGRRRADGRVYAIKITDLDALTPWSRQAAVREARVLAALTGAGTGGFRHPCIATYREAFCLQSRLCIVTDPARGGDLKKLLERRGGGLPEPQVWSIFLQTACALQHLHAHRLLHRDLKPHNILIAEGGVVQLTDFGICGQLSRVFTRKEAGTPQYKAPEMWSGQPYSFSSDVWALGCLLYEMCAGRPLFDAPGAQTPEEAVQAVRQQVLALASPPALPAGYSSELGQLLAALLRPAPAERPSADELLAMPAAVARLGDLPAVVRQGLAGAAAAQQRWQQEQRQLQLEADAQERLALLQQKGAAGGSPSPPSPVLVAVEKSGKPCPGEPRSFHPIAVNACMPPAAYSNGGAGLLGAAVQQQDQEQFSRSVLSARGRPSSRHLGDGLRDRSASGASERTSTSSVGGDSNGGVSISGLDLAVPAAAAALVQTSPPSPASLVQASPASAVAALGGGSASRRLAPRTPALSPMPLTRGLAGGSSIAAMLSRQSCPTFFETAASSGTVQI